MERLERHPVLKIEEGDEIEFDFEGKTLTARNNEVISSALFANGIRTFGFHHKDGSPQGIFCANGQCAQCMVIADGQPVKSCMEHVREGMKIQQVVNLPSPPDVNRDEIEFSDIEELVCDLLVIGAGPSGLGAAIEAATAGLDVILADDKSALGGKLLLQTHTFFGSVNECYAGTRGVDIADILSFETEEHANIRALTEAMAVGIYVDGKIGIVHRGVYKLVKPKSLLVATGAREKALVFPGCDLPGVYGAGAFQTLLNRDHVIPSDRLFIVGGGNVGIIAAYHAMQAGITVVGLCEGLPEVGGYWVHANKIKRLGVPIYTSTTVVSANGDGKLESVTVAEVDANWKVKPETTRTYACDTLLIAVGLERVNEIYEAALKFGIDAYVAGDAEEIAEASAAMFSGRVRGREIAQKHGRDIEVPEAWRAMTRILKSKPGREDVKITPPSGEKVFPVFRCTESIPCNPCTEVCPQGSIKIESADGILKYPIYTGNCTGCGRCVALCPGMAISLVDERGMPEGKSLVTIPFEMIPKFTVGDEVRLSSHRGDPIGVAAVVRILDKKTIAPCRVACPSGVNAPRYIELIRKKDYAGAIESLRRDIPLPAVCGRVCYFPCEKECGRNEIDEPVAICQLKRFVADWAKEHGEELSRLPVRRREKVAVVGSGPAGLACANEIIRRGYAVTVFDAAPKAGGMLRYGIPQYRLPDDVLDHELGVLEKLGIEIRTGTRIENIEKLKEDGYDAIFIATGAQVAAKMGIAGEDLAGVTDMLAFLKCSSSGDAEELSGTVAVIGGGNSAMDAARVAVRLGAKEVRVVYRRSREEMPAHDWEIEEAAAEGVEFDYLTAPVEILGRGGRVHGMKCIEMRLGEPDESERRRPEPVEGSEFTMSVDHVIVAIGQKVESSPLIERLKLTKWQTVETDPMTQATNVDGVFAGGDAATGASNVAYAFGAGKRAAESIDRYLRGIDLKLGRDIELPSMPHPREGSVEEKPRSSAQHLDASSRRGNFREITQAMTEDAAQAEVSRCLNCGIYADCIPGVTKLARNAAYAERARIADKSVLVTLEVPKNLATEVAGIRIQNESALQPVEPVAAPEGDDDTVVCRCERITLGKIRDAIRMGVRDMNQLKAMLKVGMGACGGKTCGPLIKAAFRREGVAIENVTPFTERPLIAEAPLGMFAGIDNEPK